MGQFITGESRWLPGLLLVLIIANCQVQKPIDPDVITGEELSSHVQYLASDERKGRRTGSPGAHQAAKYIVNQWKISKIKPAGDRNYYQKFDFIAGVELGDRNACVILRDGEESNLLIQKDFRPLGFSKSGAVTGGLVFAGYGISADSLHYDDYSDLDVKGKVVLVLRYGPEGDNPHGEFGKYLSLRYKASNAKSHGAAGIIVISGPEPYPEDELVKLTYDQSADAGIPAISARRGLFESIFVEQLDSLREIQADINLHKRGMGSALSGVTVQLRTDLSYVHRDGINVLGLIEGRDPDLQNTYIILGAHYDHLGLGGEGSLAPGTTAVHNGADDNASGTAGLLELAEYFAVDSLRPRHSILFAAFSGEEEGLLGSTKFTAESPVALDSALAMLNMDMVGRPQDSSLIIGGTGTSPAWDTLLTKANSKYRWKLTKNEEGYGPSDHASFYMKDIPVLFFFTGVHEDYHRPTDDWNRLNYQQYAGIIRYISEIVRAVDARSDTLPFQKAGGTERRNMQFRVSLQIIPDYAANVHGLRIADVKEQGPAARAGLQAGDIIVQFGNKEINNIYDYTFALQEFEPGAVADLIVIRNGTEKRVSVKLERRD